jgi:hypothetical protein
MDQLFNLLAVAGAWVGGLGVVFAVLSFCFGIINPRLMQIGQFWLVAADIGLIVMLGSLLYFINTPTLWAFTLAGLIILIGITVFVFMVVRLYSNKDQGITGFIENTRQRIEF